jgi:phosphoribosylamine--glycine ligase
MGAVAPVPWVSDADLEHVRKTVIMPVLAGMQSEGTPFTGTLYAGLMWTSHGPRVLEFNVRFGDPEAEVLMPLCSGDVASLLLNAAQGNLPARIETRTGSAAAIVIAAKGYPNEPSTGTPVDGLSDIPGGNVAVFHGGTRTEDNKTISTSGRILTVSGWGDDLQSALDAAYDAVRRIKITGSFFRGDIGRRHIGADRERTKR